MKGSAALKILLVFPGVITGLLLCEILLYIAKGNLSSFQSDQDFRWRNIDIHQKFFKNAGGHYVAVRPRGAPEQFELKKPPNEKRVFLLGESVAEFFPKKVLEDKFQTVFPKYRWKVINCGMSAYDSYRIARIAREAINYEPDLFILMMGNNDGVHDPVFSPKYKYPLIYKFYTLSYICDIFFPPVHYTGRTFEDNLSVICGISEKNKLPLVVITLPTNLTFSPNKESSYLARELFEPMWLVWKNPSSVLRLYAKNKITNGDWFLGKAYELIGQQENAARYYLPASAANFRNNLIRKSCSGRRYIILVDFDRILVKFARNIPGFEYFSDACHYWPPVYGLIANIVIDSYSKNKLCRDTVQNSLPAITPELLVKLNRAYFLGNLQKRLFNIFTYSSNGFAKAAEKTTVVPYFDGTKDFVKFCIKNDPELFILLRKNTDQCIRQFPKTQFEPLFVILGAALREEHNYGDALYFLNRAETTRKGDPILYLLRGLCYYDLHRPDKAETDFKSLRALLPGYEWLDTKYLKTLERK